MAYIKAYYIEQVTSNTEHWDEDETGREIQYMDSETTRTLVVKEFDPKEIRRVFEVEDGDGDESGSWGISLKFIVGMNNKIIWDEDQKFRSLLNNHKPMDCHKIMERLREELIRRYEAI